MILRRVARPLLASIFIYGGINVFRNVEVHANLAKPLLDKTIGASKDVLPECVPTDAETLVKVDAAVKIAAGSALAFGKAPRLAALLLAGSIVPTTLAAHPYWDEQDPAQRQHQLIQFLKNAGLLGGLLLAVSDTHGKPSLGWRARRAARKAGKAVESALPNT